MPRRHSTSDSLHRLSAGLDADPAALAAEEGSFVREVNVRSLDAAEARRFVRDVIIKTRVSHPHLQFPIVIAMSGTGIARLTESKPSGRPIADMLLRLTPAELDSVIGHILIGLAHLHDIGLAHGSVDSNHVMVSDDPTGVVARLVGIEPRRNGLGGDGSATADLVDLHLLMRSANILEGSAASAAMGVLSHAAGDATIDAHAAIAAMASILGRRPRPVSRVPLPTPNVSGHFIGREQSLDRVLGAVRSALNSGGERRIAISGQRGAGLSTLLNEVALMLEWEGVRVARCVALGDGTPLLDSQTSADFDPLAWAEENRDSSDHAPLVLVVDDADRLTSADVVSLRRLLELPKELPIAVVMAIPECSGGLSTVGHGIAGACPTERLRGLRPSDVQTWIAATGLGRLPLTQLLGSFDDGGGYLPATVARRLTGAFTGVVTPFLSAKEPKVTAPMPVVAPRSPVQPSVSTDEAGIRFLSNLAEQLAASASEDDVVRVALPRMRQVSGAIAAALLDEGATFVERGDCDGIKQVEESDSFALGARNLLRTCATGSIVPVADPANGITVFPFPNGPVGRGVAILGGLDPAVPGSLGRSHLVALASMQTGQALAMIRTEARRRDAEIVSLENTWLRDHSRRAASESERLRTLHDKLRLRTDDLETATASLKALFDALTGHMVIAWGLDGHAGARNAAAASLLGAKDSPMPLHFDALATDGTPRFADLVHDAARGERVSIETNRRAIDGTVLPIQLVLSPLLGQGGDVRGWVEVSRDLTQEIDARHRTLLSERLAALGTLSAGVAHEFNNLLQGIMGWLEYALSVDDRGAVRRATATALGAASRASEVTHRLQAFARPRGDVRVPTRLADLVEETLRLVSRGLEAEGCRVNVRSDRAVAARVDQTCILQVILNLVTNARHAMAKSSTRELTVTTTREDGDAIMTITDTGPGIPEAMQSLVFDPFFTTKAVRQDGAPSGTGLGLSLAQSIILEHGGTLCVRSRPGEGATFEIRLPAVPVSTVDAPPARQVDESRAADRVLSILIVGDDASTRGVLAERLCMRGHSVVLSSDVAGAKAILERGGIDVAVVDDGVGNGEQIFGRTIDMRGAKRPRYIRLCGDPNAVGFDGDGIQSLQKPFTAALWIATVEGEPPQAGRPRLS